MSYDVIIVGGGLAGLHTGYRLQQAGLKCLILEGSKRLGGRVYTKRSRAEAKAEAELYECGAAKLLPSHTRMIELIKELGWRSEALEASDKPIMGGLKEMVKALREEPRAGLLKITLKEWMMMHYDEEKVNHIIKMSGYWHLFEKCNAYNGIQYLERDFIEATKIVTFVPGLSQIVMALKVGFKKTGGNIISGVMVTTVAFAGDYIVNGRFHGKRVVFAVPPRDLEKIEGVPDIFLRACKGIVEVPLIRIYANGDIGDIPYTCTGNVIQRTGMRGHGLYQLVYASAANAEFWKKIIGLKLFKEAFTNNIKTMFPKAARNIDTLKNIDGNYWDAGVHLWRPGFDGEKVWKDCLRGGGGMYVVGEAFCPYQRWMESALMTSSDVVDLILAP